MEKLLELMQICDSLFPIGAFSLSNGLETFTLKNRIKNASDLDEYIDSLLKILPYNELGFMSFIANSSCSSDEIIRYDNLFAASRIASEIRKGSEKLCKNFIKLMLATENTPELELYKKLIAEKKCHGHHVVAMSLYVKEKGIALETALTAYSYNIVSSAVTNAVKLVPLSQVDGQKVLNRSFEKITTAVATAIKISEEDLCVSGAEFDIYAMNHETLYSRSYMS